MADVQGTPETPQNPQREADRPQGPADVPPIVDRYGPLGREADPKARLWAMFCHLAGFAGLLPVVPGIGCLLGPLIIWLIKKNEFLFVDDQGKEAVNFQITMFIYLAVGALLIPVCGIGLVVMIAVGIIDAIFLIIAAIKANDGYHYRYPYPLIIRFIK